MRTGKLIFITGVSSGLGRAFARRALSSGYRVVGTLRDAGAVEAFAQLAPGRAHGRLLDVTDYAEVARVVGEVEATLGPIDVMVNNAGYGHEGVFEESPLEEMQRQFAVNVFGAVAVMKAVLPAMRARRAGRIVNITSMGGFITMPGIAYYCGSKFALEGISEAVGKEVSALGVHVTAVAPGSFRTDWAGRSMVRTPRSIADYDTLFDPVRARRQAASGRQLGEPDRAADALLELIESEAPPAHLLLGSDALELVREKLTALDDEIRRCEALTRSTDG